MRYKVEYLTMFGAMTINVNYFECSAWCKYHAWKKFLKAHYNDSNHYACGEYLKSYWHMRKDITRLPAAPKTKKGGELSVC